MLAFTLTLWAAAVQAQGVALGGVMGSKALLVIDGQAYTVPVGGTIRGVTLVQLGDNEADVRRDKLVTRLRLGGAPVSLEAVAARAAQKREIVLPASPGGHFMAPGAINGKAVQFMVDTGATYIALGLEEAQRIGLDLSRGETGMTQTANGPVKVTLITLSSVRIGGIELANVRAVVLPQALPFVLLGNSYLSRFAMRRDADVMRLELRH